LQIASVVVLLVAVLVMNNFAVCERPPEHLLGFI